MQIPFAVLQCKETIFFRVIFNLDGIFHWINLALCFLSSRYKLYQHYTNLHEPSVGAES